MEATSLWYIKGRLKDLIDYVENPEKTVPNEDMQDFFDVFSYVKNPLKTMKTLRKEVRLCGGIEARSDILKEKLTVIRADEKEQQGKELMKNDHRRRSGRANRKDELGGI